MLEKRLFDGKGSFKFSVNSHEDFFYSELHPSSKDQLSQWRCTCGSGGDTSLLTPTKSHIKNLIFTHHDSMQNTIFSHLWEIPA